MSQDSEGSIAQHTKILMQVAWIQIQHATLPDPWPSDPLFSLVNPYPKKVSKMPNFLKVKCQNLK